MQLGSLVLACLLVSVCSAEAVSCVKDGIAIAENGAHTNFKKILEDYNSTKCGWELNSTSSSIKFQSMPDPKWPQKSACSVGKNTTVCFCTGSDCSSNLKILLKTLADEYCRVNGTQLPAQTAFETDDNKRHHKVYSHLMVLNTLYEIGLDIPKPSEVNRERLEAFDLQVQSFLHPKPQGFLQRHMIVIISITGAACLVLILAMCTIHWCSTKPEEEDDFQSEVKSTYESELSE